MLYTWSCFGNLVSLQAEIDSKKTIKTTLVSPSVSEVRLVSASYYCCQRWLYPAAIHAQAGVG